MRRRLVLAGLLAVPLLVAADDTPPPPGWKEYRPKDGGFSVFLPGGKSIVRNDREQTVTVRGVRIKVNVVSAQTRAGLTMEASTLALPARLVRIVSQKEKIELVRDTFLGEVVGRVTGETDATLGEAAGKEYSVQSKKGLARLRVAARSGQIYWASVAGKKGQIASKIADAFLDSYKLSAKAPDAAAGAPATKGK